MDYTNRLLALWDEMYTKVYYLIGKYGAQRVRKYANEVIEVLTLTNGYKVTFTGTADDVANAVDSLVAHFKEK